MYHWRERRFHIAETVMSVYPDVIGFQEVRKTKHLSQIDELQLILSEYRWSYFEGATTIDDDGVEGLAILSRYPIESTSKLILSSDPNDLDTNTRVCLFAHIDHPFAGKINFYVTHLSYHRSQQCRNAKEITKSCCDACWTSELL
eukprot:TRINITY_DN3420_c0_g1_i2.p1 TRINITY_DN3420_c0_g1~~TRINITY_DN3420_c0_g1_i2.p1  ORF type:complete len:145 (+),score=14.59 TRINITY_DN3420_c0_g1_i2:74-508(+)